MSTLDQFVKFTTDSVGLERTFRLLQAITQIISSYALPFDLLIYLLGSASTSTGTKGASPEATREVLLVLRQRLALGRRFFRLFRFVESFQSAQKLYSTLSPAPPPPPTHDGGNEKKEAPQQRAPSHLAQVDAWFDVFGRTFNGMYLLLEASTMIEALQVNGLAIWSPATERAITVEAQRFWLFSLVCGVFSGLLKILHVLAYTPVPAPGEGYGQKGVMASIPASPSPAVADEKEGDGEKRESALGEDENSDWDLRQEQKRLRGVVQDRKQGRDLWRGEIRTKITKLGRGVVANALDITLPGTVVGWVEAESGTVGLAMLVTTILTGMDVWERCGREVSGGG